MTTELVTFAETYLNAKGISGVEVAFCCPFHDDSDASASMNTDTGAWMCFACHEKGGIGKLAARFNVRWHRTAPDALSVLQDKLDRLNGRGTVVPKVRYLPESDLDQFDFPTDYWTDVRRFKQDTIDAFDLGYDPMNNIAIIPVRDVKGNLIGVLRRFLDPDASPKYKESKGFKKSHHLFASWYLEGSPSAYAVLVEGACDAMSGWQAGEPTMAQYGSYLSPEQIRVMRRMGFTTVVLFYDNDEGGDLATSWSLGYEHHKNGRDLSIQYNPEHDLRKFFLVKRVKWTCKRKDPGQLSARAIRSYVANANYVR